METTATLTFEPRYPTRNAGYIFVVVTLILSLLSIIFFFNVIVNDHQRTDADYGQFNWLVMVVSVVVGVALFWASLWVVRRFLHNQPRRVVLETTNLIIQDEQGETLANVPYQEIVTCEETKETLAKGQYEASYKQVRLEWAADEQPHALILSERDTLNFDELMDGLWERCPPEALGPRTFER